MSINAGFWGLTVEPNKSYSEEVEDDFEVSMAALDVKIKGDKRCCLKVTVEDKTFVLCSLIPGKVEQQQLTAKFNAGETVTFESTGETAIHLTGNYTEPAYDQDPYGFGEEEDDDDESVDDDDDALLEGLLNGDDSMEEDEEDVSDEEDEDEDGASRIEELNDVEMPEVKPSTAKKPSKEVQAEKAAPKDVAKSNKRPSETETPPASKKVKAEQKEEKKATKPEVDTTPKKRELPNGLVIQDTAEGDASASTAKNGKRVGMRYIGKLTNGKVFDSNTKGKPFNFVLGKGEVIKGWDLGIQGMKVGGERRLTIPAPLAYGKQKQAGIPANSTLVFDVKLLSVK